MSKIMILILLAAILLSNIINRFLPSVSVTIIQILLGAGIALLPLGFHMELAPELFFVLFIAPQESKIIQKYPAFIQVCPVFQRQARAF